MIYNAIDTFYLNDEELRDSPSRKDGIDEATEINLRIYGCDLIQESGILLKLPQAVMATGQVLFHRFYCKKSFARFNVKRLAASCVWVASKLEENPRKARHVINVFHRMECRRENLPIQYLENSKGYPELKKDLIGTERHLLKEMGFICHVEHPHKFISNYLATLKTPQELRQEAWNLANDSLRTTLCVRFKSEVVACGVVYAAARRFQVPLPEDPPWWKAFDADKLGIDEVCRVLAHLYSLPKARYIPVCRKGGSFTTFSKSPDRPSQPVPKECLLTYPPAKENTDTASLATNFESDMLKNSHIKAAPGKINESKSSADVSISMPPVEGDVNDEPIPIKTKPEHKMEVGIERSKDRDRDRDRSRVRERDRDREKERLKSRDLERGRDSDREREREDTEMTREKVRDRTHHRSKDRGKDLEHPEKSSHHHSSKERDHYSSRGKVRHRHHSYG